MIATLSYRSSLRAAGLILGLAALPAFAQQNNGPRATEGAPVQTGQTQGGWNNEKFERQEFREEMEKIRKEHEELEVARDKLLDQCVNATEPQAAACEQKKQELHAWAERLHERMRALHEKMEAMHKERPEGGLRWNGNPNGNMNNGQNNSHPPQHNNTPSGTAPSGPPTPGQ